MDLNLKGRTALITGASQGIGEGLAIGFAEEGVVIAFPQLDVHFDSPRKRPDRE